ncbi:MAG: hypothetical protein JWO05_3869 [Gemmatimonadetes bacterium]|nr:hypothetical protein [Gemmatimonadota bacterium]
MQQTAAQEAAREGVQAAAEGARAQATAARAQADAARQEAQSIRDQVRSEILRAKAGQGTPGVVVNPPYYDGANRTPAYERMMFVGGLVGLVVVAIVLMPIMRALGKRLEGGAKPAPAPIDSEMRERLQRMENAIDSIAVEVERISEGSRFTTKLLSERMKDAVPRVGG